MLRDRCVGNVGRGQGHNDLDEVLLVQLRNPRRGGRAKNPLPPPMPLYMEDEA